MRRGHNGRWRAARPRRLCADHGGCARARTPASAISSVNAVRSTNFVRGKHRIRRHAITGPQAILHTSRGLTNLPTSSSPRGSVYSSQGSEQLLLGLAFFYSFLSNLCGVECAFYKHSQCEGCVMETPAVIDAEPVVQAQVLQRSEFERRRSAFGAAVTTRRTVAVVTSAAKLRSAPPAPGLHEMHELRRAILAAHDVNAASSTNREVRVASAVRLAGALEQARGTNVVADRMFDEADAVLGTLVPDRKPATEPSAVQVAAVTAVPTEATTPATAHAPATEAAREPAPAAPAPAPSVAVATAATAAPAAAEPPSRTGPSAEPFPGDRPSDNAPDSEPEKELPQDPLASALAAVHQAGESASSSATVTLPAPPLPHRARSHTHKLTCRCTCAPHVHSRISCTLCADHC